jgi:phosphatidylserine/phosphatidylglycerophosphate/cardiolipin synthase-like enzyme
VLKLLIQPQDGIKEILSAIKKATKSVDIVIFRFDRAEIESALKKAVARGVSVSALIAYANRGGEKHLRKLEMRLLDAGVTVSRTDDDLVRYHNKMLIVDRKVLYVLSFNFTHLDIDHSRAFGIVSRKTKLVAEAGRLFEADSERKPYKAGLDTFVVSPANARKQLAAFISSAKKELLIYDPNIADTEMAKALKERGRAGVTIKVIGGMSRKGEHIDVRKLTGLRLHTRTIIRDRREAFVGSQSLRKIELDRRREVGVIVRDKKTLSRLVDTFEADWSAKELSDNPEATAKDLKRAVKAASAELSVLNPLVKDAVRDVVEKTGGDDLAPEEVQDSIQKAVKEAVRERVQEIMDESGEAEQT